MMNGAAYQLLWSLFRFWKTTIRDVTPGPTDLEPEGLTLVLEPSDGGDLRLGGVESAVEQIKSRSSGRPWSLEDIIEEVLPDLYKACRVDAPPSRYRFITEGSMGQWEDVYELFRSIARKSETSDLLSLLDDEQELASAKENRALASKVRKVAGSYTQRGIFLYIAHVLREGTAKRTKAGSRAQVFQDSPEILHRNLWRLLGGFEFAGGQMGPDIEDDVLDELAARGVKDSELEKKLDSLVGSLLRSARQGEAIVTRESFLMQHRLRAVDLRSWRLIVRGSQSFLGANLNRHRYRGLEDSRESRPLVRQLEATTEKKPIVVWGESGQGKSWLLYGSAQELVRRDRVVLLLDSTQDVLRDRQEAARLFCEMIWGTDEQFSFDRLAHRARSLVPDISHGIWLTLLIDGVTEPDYLINLSAQEWEAIGVRVAVAFTSDREDDESSFISEELHSYQVRDFSLSELRRYLKLRLGEDTLLPPQDVLQLLRRPLMARLYCDRVAREGQWQPKNEYQLIEGYWIGQASHAPLSTDAVAELASRLLEGEEGYPWPLSRLREMGMGEIELTRLRKTRLVKLTRDNRLLGLWHDRLLQWAVSEGLVSQLRAKRLTSEQLQERVKACLDSDETHRRFGYVPMDTLWLLADPTASREQDVQEMLRLFESFEGTLSLVPTLGSRIVPHLFARLREVCGDSSYSELQYLDFLDSIPDRSIPGFAVEFLSENCVALQKAATRILASQGSRDALDRLWDLYRDWSIKSEAYAAVEIPFGVVNEAAEVDISDVVQVDKALGNCVRSAPDWLERAILKADPERDPVHVLVFHIPKVVNGKDLWRRVKRVAFEKVQPNHERCLALCIANFHDSDEVPWLRERVHRKEDFTGSMVLKALYLLAPEEAFQPIDGDSSFELAMGRGWWLPPFQMEYPDQTSELLLAMIKQAKQPWLAVGFFDGRENSMSEAILNFLLFATADLLKVELSAPGPDKRLYRAFSRLEDISRLDLLKLFWKFREKPLEKKLTDWLIREGPTDGRMTRLTPEAGIAVLRKIAGSGIAQVANCYLERAATYWGRDEAFDLALRASNKKTIKLLTRVAFMEEEQQFGSRSHPIDQREALRVLAELGHDAVVVQGIVRWGLRLPPDFAKYLGGRVLGDAELAPAFEALNFDSIPPGAILALGMSGRPEMASRVLAVLGKVEPESQQALACILALEILEDQSEATEQAFRRALDVPDHRPIAQRALDWLTKRHANGGEESRLEEAKRVWGMRHDRFFLFDRGEDLELLALLADNEEVRDFLNDLATSESAPSMEISACFAAIRALRKLDPISAFDAGMIQIERGPETYRKEYPKLLLDIDLVRAERALSDLLRKSDDFSLIYAIGEALDRTAQRPMLLRWLGDPDPQLCEGACFAAEAVRWSQDLDDSLFALRRAEDWNVWEAAWAALEKLRLQKEVDRLVEAFHGEKDRARRWCLLDAALDLGHPGVVAGYGQFGWFAELNRERLPYSMRKHALKRLEKQREALVKKLGDRKRKD